MIVGDFNDWRNRLARDVFARHFFHQVTSPPSLYRSFPAFLPVWSLDKVFYRGKIQIRHARLVKTHLARRASDHLPLVLDFHLAPAVKVLEKIHHQAMQGERGA